MSQRGRGARSYFEPPAEPVLDDAAERPAAMCAFCEQRPSGAEGHAGLAQQAFRIPLSERSLVRLACVFCGTNWVRQRLRAKVFEWLRVAR